MDQYPYVYEEGKLPKAFELIPLIKSLDEKYLRQVLTASFIREYGAGEEIIREGETDSWIYVLLAGKVEVSRQGKELAVFDRIGDIFGEAALMEDKPRSATVVAAVKTLCLAVDVQEIRGFRQEERDACTLAILSIFVHVLADRLKMTSEQLARAENDLAMLRAQRGKC